MLPIDEAVAEQPREAPYEAPEEAISVLGYDPTPGAVNDTGDATRLIWAIQKLRDEIEMLEQDRADTIEEAKAFYGNKIEKVEQTIQFLSGKIEAYALAVNRDGFSTPAGNCGFRTVRRKEWKMSDDQLLSYAKMVGADIRIKEQADKKSLEQILQNFPNEDVLEVKEERKFYVYKYSPSE